MNAIPRRRGRPRGTGINDNEMLRAISSLLATDSYLKPTTAIRRSGVTDPSVVRRLREKLKSAPLAPPAAPAAPLATPELNAPLTPPVPRTATAPSRPTARPSGQRPPATAPPAKPLAEAPKAVQRSPSQPPRPQDTAARISPPTPPVYPQPASQPRAPQTGPTPAQQPPPPEPPHGLPDPQLEALRLSAEAAGAMSRLYLHCMNHAAQMNPLAMALNSQNLMSQWFSGLMAAQISARQKPKP